jgi:hypothetical protein
MSLPESLERAASEMVGMADQIRPANGDPHRLLEDLSLEQADQLLAWILTEEPEAAAELLDGWGESEQGAGIVLAVSDRGISKTARKVLRRARHRLRSQGFAAGVSVPTPFSSTTQRTRRISQAKDRWQEAHISAPDFRGTRVGYLVDPHPTGGARLFEIRFDDARGILDFKIYHAGRSKVRGFLRSLTGGSEQRLFDVDRDPLRALVRRASLSQPLDRPLPSGFVEWRGRLFSRDLDEQPTPGELVRTARAADLPSLDAAEPLDLILSEIRLGRLGPWPPQSAWVGDCMSAGRAAVENLTGKARTEAIESWLNGVAETLAKQTDPVWLAHQLEELAWVRWQSVAEFETQGDCLPLLAVANSIAKQDGVIQKVSRARVDGIFASFLVELRGADEEGLDPTEGSATSD